MSKSGKIKPDERVARDGTGAIVEAAQPSDVADFGEKDLSGAYPPGTKFSMPDGSELDVNAVPDIIGRKRSAE